MGSPAKTVSARHSQTFAAAMLMLACLCWGGFFSLTKSWFEHTDRCPGGQLVAALTLIGIRPVLALLIFAAIRPILFTQPTRREWLTAGFLGFLNFLGNVFQVWGLSATSPALSGFFTSMASLWVPVISLIVLQIAPMRATWLGLVLGITGLAVLGIDLSKGWLLGMGEALTVLASMIFAVFILCLDRLGRRVRSSQLTLGLIAVGGLPALPLAVGLSAWGDGVGAWLEWLREMLSNPRVVLDVLLLTLLSTVLATYLMGTFQPRVPASRAALIYLVEPVFAAAISVILGHDEIKARLVLGGLLILGGNALSELPAWLRQHADY
jgi:drug/metabolite transporter (DMT)-like permease